VNLKDLTPTLRVILILTLVGMLLGSIVALTIVGKDTAGIYTFGGAILIGLGVMAGVTGQVASNTNGNTGQMLKMLEETSRVNAQLVASLSSMTALMTPSSKEAEAHVIEMSRPVLAIAPVSPAPTDNGYVMTEPSPPRAPV
jgi:hypothetical protein